MKGVGGGVAEEEEREPVNYKFKLLSDSDDDWSMFAYPALNISLLLKQCFIIPCRMDYGL